MTIHAVALGRRDDVLLGLLADVAGDTRRAHLAPDAETLSAIYREIAGRVRGCP